MKTLNKILFTLAGALLLFTACEEQIADRDPSPVMAANCQGVFFPATNAAIVEMEPSEPTQISIAIARSKSDAAITVPVTAEINDGNVFVFPATVAFAAGQTETTFTVTFPSAAEGTSYNLKLTVAGEEFVDQYSAGVPYLATNVTRVKWNPLESVVWVDGLMAGLFGIEQIPMYVQTEKASIGTSTRYRFKTPYVLPTAVDADGIFTGYPYNEPGEVDEANEYLIVVEVDRDGNAFMPSADLGFAWASYGAFSIGSYYGNVSSNLEAYPLGKLEDEVITFPASSLYITLSEYQGGSTFVHGTPTYIYLNREDYIAANMKIKDYNDVEYEIIPGAVSEFMSNAYEESWGQPMAKAIDIDGENPNSEYKNLYYLGDVYVPDFGIAFYYDGRALTVPANQPIGDSVFGQDLYVSQSEEIESSVSTTSKGVMVYTLGLKFHYEDGTILGHFAETYYYSEDPVSYALEDFYGNYHVTGPCAFDGYPDADMNVRIAAGSSANSMVITGIDYAESIVATFDPTTSTISILPQNLADYQGFDIALYTYIFPGYYSTTPLLLGFNMAGQLVKAPNSETDGYLLRSEAIGDWVDGYYNLKFTPQAAQKAPRKETLSAPIAKPLQKIKIEKAKEGKSLNKGNFVIQGKPNPKKIKSISHLTPIF
jgi:hypothetical protein